MATLEERFEAKVDRSGEHHLWTGSKLANGTGKLKVDGRTVTAQRVAWELANGPLLDGSQVMSCPADKSCVRVDHLTTRGRTAERGSSRRRSRASPGAGSMTEIRPGVWKLTVSRGRYADGTLRREYDTVEAATESEAAGLKAAFVAEVDASRLPKTKDDRDIVVDDAIERYLAYLRDERGREERTIQGYRQVHQRWFKPDIGRRRVRDLDELTFDEIFGRMQRAGRARSTMKQGLNLYRPFLRWAKRQRYITRSPLTGDYELPTSNHLSKDRVPAEVEQLALLLRTAAEFTPDVVPILTLGAVTGMRRGELVAVRRSRFDSGRGRLYVDTAANVVGTKLTKTRKARWVSLDAETVAMIERHIHMMEDRAAANGADLVDDPFLFSLEPDCSKRMPPSYVTRQVAKLKDILGVADKRPETVALEDEALRLFRTPQQRATGRPGPPPKAGEMSYPEIGRRLGRSQKWAFNAVASAKRRELAATRGQVEYFDASVLGLRKFASTELLDAGFNISAVADRQGHGPQVLAKHYSRGRPSTDRRAAEHLGRLIHRPDGHAPSNDSNGLSI